MQYRLVEVAPVDGKPSTTTKRKRQLYAGDLVGLRAAIDRATGPDADRWPYSDLRFYHGKRRIYSYEF